MIVSASETGAPPPLSSELRLEDVSIFLGGRALFPPMTFSVPGGQVSTIMGASGAGKSTLLAFICGALSGSFQASGKVFINDVEISALPVEKRRVGILFQDDLLFPHMSVGENLLFALPAKNGVKNRRALAESALEEAGLGSFFSRAPDTLSGGQRARVSVMRTLLSSPRALLLDEPFSALDAETRLSFRTFVFDHAREHNLPTLLVTHDPLDAEAAGGPVTLIGEQKESHS